MMISFVKQHNLWTDAQWAAAESLSQRVEEEGIDLIRLSFADQHGVLRGKSVFTDKLETTLENEVS
ncbi:MAG: glutamine synthetase, partial [Chloroflexota bacterium]